MLNCMYLNSCPQLVRNLNGLERQQSHHSNTRLHTLSVMGIIIWNESNQYVLKIELTSEIQAEVEKYFWVEIECIDFVDPTDCRCWKME